MARLNIEDEFFLAVVSMVSPTVDVDKAYGNALRFIRMSQEKFKTGRVVSDLEFQRLGFLPELVGIFAKKVEGGYEAMGAKKYFNWLLERTEAAQVGGRISAQRERDAKGRLLPRDVTPPNNPSKLQANSKQTSKQTKQIQASSSSSSSSSISNSSSCSKINTEPAALGVFEELVKQYPKPSGSNALKRFKEQIKTDGDTEDLRLALKHYLAMLALPENDWRRPKQTFEAFLGTKSSGYFWRSFIDPESCKPTMKIKGKPAGELQRDIDATDEFQSIMNEAMNDAG